MEISLYEEFGNRLQLLIEEAGYGEEGQRGLAKRFGVTASTVSFWLNGLVVPSMPTALRIAHSLGCCVEYLMTGRGPKWPGRAEYKEIDFSNFDWDTLPQEIRTALESKLKSMVSDALTAVVDEAERQRRKLKL